MTDPSTTPNPIMAAIGHAVTEGRCGDLTSARAQLLRLWSTIGVTGDPLHRCTLAHHLADLYDDPAEALAWDVRALDAADAVTEQRVQQQYPSVPGVSLAGFYPSLHVNLADDYRRLGPSPPLPNTSTRPRNTYPISRMAPTVSCSVALSSRSPRRSASGTPHRLPAPPHDPAVVNQELTGAGGE